MTIPNAEVEAEILSWRGLQGWGEPLYFQSPAVHKKKGLSLAIDYPPKGETLPFCTPSNSVRILCARILSLIMERSLNLPFYHQKNFRFVSTRVSNWENDSPPYSSSWKILPSPSDELSWRFAETSTFNLSEKTCERKRQARGTSCSLQDTAKRIHGLKWRAMFSFGSPNECSQYLLLNCGKRCWILEIWGWLIFR